MQHPRKVMIDLSSDNRSKEKHPGPGYHLQTHAVELTFGWEVAHQRKERSKRANFH